ncbi:MAG TPA: YicC family protein [Henriciella marina]|uniref:YicC/YloC family endoribonuclease n=1 Tax=Henriciella sp. TaxID=1968823 RepID=UPI0017D5706B|nr:YicC/YloC family endoribonuclease [Henriciella sp.]HIG21457.1 YicC family protein [Henriciella sp.]HIK63703.1 YicC family protein [Henriciella marina]
MSARVSSMTGFARVSGEADWGSWAIEAKSVNGRSLDVRVNVPSGFEEVERAIKQAASKLFARGNIQIGLRIEVSGGAETLSVNHDALQQLLRAFETASGRAADLGAIASLMSIKGVVETGQSSTRAVASEEAVAALQAGGDELVTQLNAARLEEGAALEEMLSGYLTEMARVVDEAEALAAEQPKLLKARLEKQLAELDASDKVDGERLAAEIALSVAKADVREEIDRLRAHIESGRGLLKQGGPIGRKLDFLSQEFNREANTLCSKSASLDLTNAGLALKGLVDQFKEQAANVE